MNEKTFHLAIRFSDNLFSIGDVVVKHNEVFYQKGYVWFGKMGQTISQTRMDLLNRQIAQSIPTFVYLVKGNRKKSTFYRADLIAITKELPIGEEVAIPSYYQNNNLLQYMKTWVRISEIVAIEISVISHLQAIGSVFPLQETLIRSSSGYFLVREAKNI